jgi:quinol monooxygenase YgiN
LRKGCGVRGPPRGGGIAIAMLEDFGLEDSGMRSGRLPALALALACLVAAPAALARARARAPVYRVIYTEAAGSKVAAAKALKRLAALGRRDGALEFDVLQSRSWPEHFALVEAWKDQRARQAFAADRKVRRVRASLAPLLSGPWDERPLVGLAVGGHRRGARPAGQAPAAVVAVAHVDVMPRAINREIAALEALRTASRREPGALRFDVLQQANMTNHFTLVETWTDPRALEAYEQAAATRKFRETLAPVGGSPYDERLYSAVN